MAKKKKKSFWNSLVKTIDPYQLNRRNNKVSTNLYNAAYEAKNYGIDYVKNKYGDKVDASVLSYIRKQASYTPKRLEKHKTKLTGAAHKFDRMGMFAELAPPEPPPAPEPQGPPEWTRKMQLNLENDSELAQGHHTPWATPTSVSSLITGLLRQSQNSAGDYWEQFFSNKPADYTPTPRDSSPWGIDPMIQNLGTAATQNPMGAFGALTFEQPGGLEDGMMYTMDAEDGEGPPPPINNGEPPAPPQAPTGGHVYNPWGYGEGALDNDQGNNPAHMTASTMEALALANAYFAPQRLELAYELGDMETDMRRMAVNLGRQIDDPVLQAKLYKEGMRAVRTLDTQQNTFAFQMAEQRRREETQNAQFYSQLGQEEYKLRLQHYQFLKQLQLQGDYFNLQRFQVINPPGITPPQGGTNTGGGTVTGPAGDVSTLPSMSRTTNFFNPPSVNVPGGSNLYGGNLLQYNPYG